MDSLIAIDQLDDLVHNAKAVPFSDQVRIDAEHLNAALEDLLTTLPPGLERHPTIDAHLRLAELVRGAQPVPLTDQVRLDKESIYDLLDRLRADLPQVMAGLQPLDPRAQPLLDALDTVEELVNQGRGFLRPASRVDAGALRAAMSEVHAATPVEVSREDRDGDLEALDRLIAEAPAARGDRVQLRPGETLDVLDRIRALVDATCRG